LERSFDFKGTLDHGSRKQCNTLQGKFNRGTLNYHRLKDDGFVVRQRYFKDRSEGHPIYGVVVYADWTKPPAFAGGDRYLHTYCYLKDDRLTDGGFNPITDE